MLLQFWFVTRGVWLFSIWSDFAHCLLSFCLGGCGYAFCCLAFLIVRFKIFPWDFPGGPAFHCRGPKLHPWFGELRCHMPTGQLYYKSFRISYSVFKEHTVLGIVMVQSIVRHGQHTLNFPNQYSILQALKPLDDLKCFMGTRTSMPRRKQSFGGGMGQTDFWYSPCFVCCFNVLLLFFLLWHN